MSAKGVDFLELWIERNVLPTSVDRTQAARLAKKLDTDVVAEGLAELDALVGFCGPGRCRIAW